MRRLWMGLVVILMAPAMVAGQVPDGAAEVFGRYVDGVEARLGRQHAGVEGFVVGKAGGVERVEGGPEVAGAAVHHWRGTAFAAGARAGEFERVLKDVGGYSRVFGPEVVWARVVGGEGDRVGVAMRVRQKHGITVVMDSVYGVEFGRLDGGHGWSRSRSTEVREIEGAGTPGERALGAGEEHGFLWRQNTYWSWAERDGGLEVQVESVSLTRAVPRGLGWAVGAYVEKVPRESLEFTLRAVCEALRKK